MDELDPYRDMPMSSKEDLALDASEYSTETFGMNGGFGGQHADADADMPPVRTDNGLLGYGGQGGHTVVGRREGAPLSAQASRVTSPSVCFLLGRTSIEVSGPVSISEGQLLSLSPCLS